jgi:predicted nucleotidyltransferase
VDDSDLRRLLQRFQDEGVEYVLVGGFAVRMNGFLRLTEDIDVLLPRSVENGRRVIKSLNFLESAQDLVPEWFEPPVNEPENIRVADALLIDLLFAANGETFESLKPHMRRVDLDGTEVVTLDIDGLLKTKTDYRDKDKIDRLALEAVKRRLQ